MTDPHLLAGRYRLLERRDRTGTTWRSRDELLNRDVTISEVRLPPPGPHRDWLLGQIRAASGLRHPDIATLHDVVSAPDRMWLVLETIEGRSLIQTVRSDGPLSAERAAEIGLRVLDALAAAHEGGVRLAAAPETVLLASDGRVVLTGIASSAPADDLRDLGATLFTAVEGRMPETGPQTVPRMGDGTPLAAPAAGPAGAGPLAPLVESLLSADPAHQLDATSIRLSLESLTRKPRSSRPRPVIVTVAAVVAALAVTGGVMWGVSGDPTPAPASPSASYVDPGPFSKSPQPCELLTAEQLARLGVRAKSNDWGGMCIWGAADSSEPRSLQRQLSVTPKLYRGAAEAARVFAGRFAGGTRSAGTADGRTQTAPRKVGGLGNDAFAGEVTSVGYSSTVVVRVNNLIVEVQYQQLAGEPQEKIKQDGLMAAGWIVGKLTRKG
ncbi:hypothetical protein [Streptosporangium sp. NBC_01756]|uniref:hypothetical protein n=1 Tax=Streptosporangium sp. NBC_01756 TaxID=2975950 RepID=UPI002DDC6C69|nr:hypothetical protein [Streptosporangium sp. NBC_01756]WSC83971.1 hypothetical protein OIE48_26690 [Streptosporangium sp. NBC_01756]